ncbi:hypothetical protein BC835DRAFT_866038 [Cytidiella melzeri]|nr:hypothetical protein BC835DRAFT_866038 [Cytidiella melzeri]
MVERVAVVVVGFFVVRSWLCIFVYSKPTLHFVDSASRLLFRRYSFHYQTCINLGPIACCKTTPAALVRNSQLMRLRERCMHCLHALWFWDILIRGVVIGSSLGGIDAR